LLRSIVYKPGFYTFSITFKNYKGIGSESLFPLKKRRTDPNAFLSTFAFFFLPYVVKPDYRKFFSLFNASA